MNYLSTAQGLGGTLKSKPEDFLVEEIAPDGTVYEIGKHFSRSGSGNFTHFVLQKTDWSTSSVILELAKRLNTSHKRFNTAGTKDKVAITTQAVSAFNIPVEKILDLRIKDVSINGAWNAQDKIHMGELLGNRFTITLNDADCSGAGDIANELAGRFPNYFGEQRFGTTRKNTAITGQKLLEGKIEEAISIFLCDSNGEENETAKQARLSLAETGDYKKAMQEFPRYLRLERKLISYLAQHPGKFKESLQNFPRSTLLLFIHAFQSQLFNMQLSDRISEGIELEEGEYFCGETLGFPDVKKADAEGWICGKLIGYQTPLNEREKELLEKFGMTKENFRMKHIPEIASKGTYRTLLAPLKDFNHDNNIFRFALQSGSYATVAMREFIKG
ncbi:MAG: tRNA pseudouridine(13) synthase TruD [Candidatus Micrarchaeota archaeon]|nr:tRNA pseudouridine(13) synthase TruD [Candidatus Micrarchaeota archaeon]MBU1682192.1 tRNA pseudouridine(13) synthase TruD [Candidatus Micrarchaeota archaeon]